MDLDFTYISQKDGYQTRLFCSKATAPTVLGNVLVLHGMAEHHKRYLDFIFELNRRGFHVYTYDHRGHGTDKKLSELGFISAQNGDTILIEDAITVCRFIKSKQPEQKLAIFGHSMGSMILRSLLSSYHESDCAIVSSSAVTPPVAASVGVFLANMFCLFQGVKKTSPFLQKMMFGGKAYSSLCTRTSYDWLTKNNTIVGQYINDPYCGFTCTTGFYRDLIRLSRRCAQKRTIKKTKKDAPILFLTGGQDPVGGYGSHIRKLYNTYLKLRFTNVELKIYPEDRHELLNELNAPEVYQDIITFICSHFSKDL